VIAALETVAYTHYSDLDMEPVSLAERIAFFNETRHSFGRSALLLSGGATLGMYHIGVIKALYEQDLLPRVISGASAGSFVSAMLAVRTDDELTVCNLPPSRTSFRLLQLTCDPHTSVCAGLLQF
jgi:hypothetical protein